MPIDLSFIENRSMSDKDGFLAIPLTCLQTNNSEFDCSIFLKIGEKKFIKYAASGIRLTPGLKQKLIDNKHSHIYVSETDRAKLHGYIVDNLKFVLSNPDVPIEAKSELFYTSTALHVQDLMASPDAIEKILKARLIVEDITEFLLGTENALENIVALLSYDYYTYTHSVNVMTYSITLARRLGIVDLDELHSLGMGAMFHDLGKTAIPDRIVNKHGPLNELESMEMRKHPELGYNILFDTGQLSFKELDIVRHHHERLDGQGYPDNLVDDEILEFTRIVTCADIYDALTTRRTYRKAYTPFQALLLMKREANVAIDEVVLREFVKLLSDIGKETEQ